ncbi:hypothetical protein OF001_U30191 [Pseudomonas sp. OF001]|nr:hypothetical protein OF001_U30191 [Pseudomonas sp. OF001]
MTGRGARKGAECAEKIRSGRWQAGSRPREGRLPRVPDASAEQRRHVLYVLVTPVGANSFA